MVAEAPSRDHRPMCLVKIVMDVLFGREEQVAYVTVTSR
jgi:hypothetical protein